MTVSENIWDNLLEQLGLDGESLELERFDVVLEGWQVELTDAGSNLATEHGLKDTGNSSTAREW